MSPQLVVKYTLHSNMLVVDVSDLIFDHFGESNRFVVVDETFGRAPDQKITVRFWTSYNIFKQCESTNRSTMLENIPDK
jgi:hypothetical protein